MISSVISVRALVDEVVLELYCWGYGGTLSIQNKLCTVQTKESHLHYYNLCSNNCFASTSVSVMITLTF